MKYFVYLLLTLIGCWLFLPKIGTSEMRNVPIFFFLLALALLYLAYKLIKLLSFILKIRKSLKKSGYRIRKTRFLLQRGYIFAENTSQALDISLIVRKRSYYQYYFNDEKTIELYKSSRSVALTNKKGTVTRGEIYSRRIGIQKILRYPFDTERCVNQILVMDKLSNTVNDSKKSGELKNGDKICSSNVILFDLNGFISYVEKYNAYDIIKL